MDVALHNYIVHHVPLQVTTNLTTEHVKGTVREGDGKRLDEQGYSR